MKITDMKTWVLGTPWRNIIVLQLETDEGITGIGEATSANREQSLHGYIADIKDRYVIGANPFEVERLWHKIFRGDYIRGGWGAMAVLSAIDIACYDIMGKALGVPIWQLLGGKFRDSVPVYANGWYTTDRDPDKIADKAREVVAKGYRALKLDPFGPAWHTMSRDEFNLSIRILEKVREAVGPDVEMLVEGHGRFNVNTAIRVAKAIEPLEPGFFEEPCPWEEPAMWAEVRQRTTVPIAGGEHFHHLETYQYAHKLQAMDITQPDVGLVGGFTQMRKVAALAEANAVQVAPHNSQGPLNTLATLHFAVACPNLKIVETFDDFFPEYVKEAFPGVPTVKDSCLLPPDKPGLGAELNEEVFKQHPPRKLFFNLFGEGWERRVSEV